MKRIAIKLILFLFVYPLAGCKNIESTSMGIDNNSYISDFELFQENPNNDTSIRITSPNAIIYSPTNNIKIFNSKIDVLNKYGQDIEVKSGNSMLNNSTNFINVFDSVHISIMDTNNHFIETNSLNWNLNNSIIDLISPLDINFENTKITSSNGTYDINSSLLTINNNIFNRSIFNLEGDEKYYIEIISDKAIWLKKNNSLEFMSDNKQVETTINVLAIK
tara:strand:+ start:534 stop:1193 length:660 start_codon:yes stop_codon:yes gene_type:complete